MIGIDVMSRARPAKLASELDRRQSGTLQKDRARCAEGHRLRSRWEDHMQPRIDISLGIQGAPTLSAFGLHLVLQRLRP